MWERWERWERWAEMDEVDEVGEVEMGARVWLATRITHMKFEVSRKHHETA